VKRILKRGSKALEIAKRKTQRTRALVLRARRREERSTPFPLGVFRSESPSARVRRGSEASVLGVPGFGAIRGRGTTGRSNRVFSGPFIDRKVMTSAKRSLATRLVTRTKESNVHASLRARNSRAKRKRLRGERRTFKKTSASTAGRAQVRSSQSAYDGTRKTVN